MIHSCLTKKDETGDNRIFGGSNSERREEPPRVFTKIHRNYIVKVKNINSEAVKTAIELSEEKYCFVGGMLKEKVEITSSYETEKIIRCLRGFGVKT